MAGVDSPESPLETVAEVAGDEVTEAFELLGNDTRLAILLALWEAIDPAPPASDSSETTIRFSALRERVGVSDSGQFNYHLNKLTGTFVRQTEAGYSLTESAEQILHAVFAGTLRDHASLEGEPIDTECYRCGESTAVDYHDGTLLVRCTSCEGAFQESDDPSGVLVKLYRPPAGLINRTPQEFHRHGNTWDRHRQHSMLEGVCPDCSGAVTASTRVCENHDVDDGTVCEDCGSSFEILSLFVCDVCKLGWVTPAWGPIFSEMAVKAFFYERGLDYEARYDASDTKVIVDAIEQSAVTRGDHLEIHVRVELAGDRLDVTLDNEAQVIEVTESAS